MRKLLCTVSILLVVPSLVRGQTVAPPSPSSTNATDVGAEITALREALARTEQQVAAQQLEIESLKASNSMAKANPTGSGAEFQNGPASASSESQSDQPDQTASLSSIKLGDALITPGGFVDFENIFRTENTQNNIATVFAAIPFSNTPQGHVTELRTTAQFSRLNVKVTDYFHGSMITGYVEGDFSGNQAANVYQSTSNLTNRLRLYYGMAEHGKWEVVGGQVWSWLTPNREGIGPTPSDLAITYNEDQNLEVGLPYTRAAELRAAYHVNDHWAIGAGIEASNQFIGTFVALPSGFSSIGTQFDNNSQVGTPNLMPDILAKTTYDTNLGARHFHAELVGLFTGAHASAIPIGSTTYTGHNAFGGGGQIAGNYELVPNKLVVLANAFWSDGGAHYLVATGPELVVRPNPAGTDFNLSMVHAGAGSVGLEWRATPKEAFAIYYAGDYYGRDYFVDTTDTAHPGTIIGYGGPGSPNTNNRALQQVTFDWLLTFWKSQRYGALQYYTQYSYLTRAPWYVAPGDPKNAHLSMVYAGIRYVLPSTSGTLLRVPYPN